MHINNTVHLRQRNPETQAQHRREVFWQITLPLLIGVLLALAAVVGIILSASQTSVGVERWADVSLMWMILPSLFFALIFLAILIGIVYGITFLIRQVPYYAFTIQHYFELAKLKISQLSNMSVEPILKMSSMKAAMHYATKRVKDTEPEQYRSENPE